MSAVDDVACPGCLYYHCVCAPINAKSIFTERQYQPGRYLELLPVVANTDVDVLVAKDKAYGGSWKKRGGVGAYMMLARKIDRLENQVLPHGYDIFAAVEKDPEAVDGVVDDIRDLRRYLMLVEAELLARKGL